MNAPSDQGQPIPAWVDFAALLGVNAFWGSTDVVAKFALLTLSPGQVAWIRFTIALLAFTPPIWVRRRLIPRSLRGLAPFVALGACGFFLNFVLVYRGVQLAPASHATALRISEALAILLLSAAFLKERIRGRAALGLGLGMVGVGLILDIDFSDLGLFKSGYRLGDLMILGGIAIEGLYTVIGKRALRDTRPLMATALACFFGWSMLSVYAAPDLYRLAVSPPPWPALLKALGACVYLGLLATAVGYWLWYVILRRRASHRVGLTVMAQPVVGIPLSALVFGDRLNVSFLGGAALIALGVYLALSSDAGSGGDGS